MFEYVVLSPIDTLIYRLSNWKKRVSIIDADPKKMKELGIQYGDRISSSELAAISVTPMAVI